MEKISIITVCYNAESVICQTIDSVLEQTYNFVELIIIDGNSSDKTVDLISQYRTRILDRGYDLIYLSETDTGIYDAMNKGILLSSGDWIHFRNAGDYFFDNYVLDKTMNMPRSASTEVIHGNIRVWDKYGYCDKKPSILEHSYKEVMPIWHPAAFVKGALHKKYLFDLYYRFSADYAFFYKCFETDVNIEYMPITIALVDVGEGASINNYSVGLRENALIRGLSKFSVSYLRVCFLVMFLSVRDYLKFLVSINFIDKMKVKNRIKAGWVINDRFNYLFK